MADKHPAEVLADDRQLSVTTDTLYTWSRAAEPMLRRIPALEAERDILISACDEWQGMFREQSDEINKLRDERDALHEARFREAAEMGLEIEELKAERDALRADAYRYRGLRAAVLEESPGMTEAEADADVDANLAERSA